MQEWSGLSSAFSEIIDILDSKAEMLFPTSSRGFPPKSAEEAEELSVTPQERAQEEDVGEWAYEEVEEGET